MIPKPKTSEYDDFQKRILGELHGILMRGEVLRKGEHQASEVWDLVQSHDRFQLHYGQYRPELIKKFGKVTNSQFFAATMGDKLNFGDPINIFRDCFETLDKYHEFLTAQGIQYEWVDPPDLHSGILLGAHYLLAPELIQLGKLISSEISGILIYAKSLVVEFLRRMIDGDREIIQELRRLGIVNRWFYLRKEPLYLQNPLESLAQSLFSRKISEKIILSSRVANLLSIGFRAELPLDELINKGTLMQKHGEEELFARFVAEKLYGFLKERVLKTVIEKGIDRGFLNLSGFPDLGEIALSIHEYSQTEGVDWASIQDLITSSAVSALKRSSKPSIKRSMHSLGSIKFGETYDPQENVLDVPNLIEMLRIFYDTARDVLEERREKFLTSASLGAQDVRSDFRQQIGDFQGRIELVSKSYIHLIQRLTTDFSSDEEKIFIAKASAFLAAETIPQVEGSTREQLTRTIYSYLSQEIEDCRKIVGEIDLQVFLLEEIALLIYVIRLGRISGIFTREWKINSPPYLAGKAAFTASRILREWLILPREIIAKNVAKSEINKIMAACGRNDIRNFYFFVFLPIIKPSNFEDGFLKLSKLFPNPILPEKKTLFVDGSIIFNLIEDQTLIGLSEGI